MSDDELQKNIFCIGKTWKKGQKKLSQKKNIIIHIIYPLYGKDFLGPVAFKPIEDQDHQYLAYNLTKPYVVGTWKNLFTEKVLLSRNNIGFLVSNKDGGM